MNPNQIYFYKYQGAGNDFVIIDNRNQQFDPENTAIINKLCDRRLGIGADGLILLQEHPEFDFEMIYFNADGHESSMCGNGGRCMIAFARHLGIVENTTSFLAIDGPHEGVYFSERKVRLKMSDVENVLVESDQFVLDTGSPHVVRFCSDVEDLNIDQVGRSVRYNDRFKEKGINVNLVERLAKNHLKVRTYERGVEAETLACGTGVTASAIAAFFNNQTEKPSGQFRVETRSGDELFVEFNYENGKFSEVWLIGPAVKVFEGKINL